MSNSSIWPIDRTLSGATTPGQVVPGSNAYEEVSIPQGSPSDFFNIILGTFIGGGGLTLLQRCSLCILQPQSNGFIKIQFEEEN